MNRTRHTSIALTVVLLFGVVLFYTGTDGFRAFTAEAARVNQLKQDKPQLPQVTLEDHSGMQYSFAAFEDKYLFITFMYTSCPTVCVELEMNMAEVYRRIPQQYLGKDITFLSISFDPERDTPTVLNRYKDYFGSDGVTWRMARVPDQRELEMLTDRFGVIVIPDGYGGFAHNSAFYLVDRSGYLIDVMDYTKYIDAAKKVTALLEKEG